MIALVRVIRATGCMRPLQLAILGYEAVLALSFLAWSQADQKELALFGKQAFAVIVLSLSQCCIELSS